MTLITGRRAIEFATLHRLMLSKLGGPIEGYHFGLSIAEAQAIAREDPALIAVEYAICVDCDAVVQSGPHGPARHRNGSAVCTRCAS